MEISYDAEKRVWTLRERGLDFDDASKVFAGTTIDFIDDRKDYGEVRWLSFGHLLGRAGRPGLDAAAGRPPHHLDEESE